MWNGKNNKKCGSGGRWAAYRYSMYGMRHLLIINYSFTVYWHVEEDNSFCFLKSIDSIFQVNQQYILNQWTTALENEFMTILERRRWPDRASGCSKSLGRPQCFCNKIFWRYLLMGSSSFRLFALAVPIETIALLTVGIWWNWPGKLPNKINIILESGVLDNKDITRTNLFTFIKQFWKRQCH